MAFTGVANAPMLMDPHTSRQHAGLQHAILWLQQEVTRPKAYFTEKSAVI